MGVQRAIAERVASALVSLALGHVILRDSASFTTLETRFALLVVATLSLIHPGFGAAVLMLLSTSAESLINPLPLFLTAPAAVLAFRFWPQALAWLAATNMKETPLSYCALTALVFLVKFATPSAAAFFMAFYTLSVGLRLSLSTPAGKVGCWGLVAARGLAGSPVRNSLELTSKWFFENLDCPPCLPLLALAHAASGAAASKLERLGAQKLAGMVPPLAMILALYILVSPLGVQPDPRLLAVPAGSATASIIVGVAKRVKLPVRKPQLRVGLPHGIAPHLEQAWTALYETLSGGERILLVFGPQGCGKTTLVRKACAACRLRIADFRSVKGRAVHIERAETLPGLAALIGRSLASGAKCVILETSRPQALLSKLGSLPVRKAIYVPPPDEEARKRVLQQALQGLAREDLIMELARSTQAYSLRGLTILSEAIKGRIEDGLSAEQAVASALRETQPDLALSDLLECESFIASFRGIVAGFHATWLQQNRLNSAAPLPATEAKPPTRTGRPGP